MKILSKALKQFFPDFLYLKLLFCYLSLKNPILWIYFLKSFFFKQKLKLITNDLILIGQIQRSGGSLLTQLFDSHSELLNYPSELVLTNPKEDWSKRLTFSSILQNQRLRKNILKQNYEKPGRARSYSNLKNFFLFNPFVEKKIFNSLKKNDLRSSFDAYFTAFFNAFLNYKNKKEVKKKFITAFLPRFFMNSKNIDLFFQIYPNGKLINIIRDPRSFLKSAKKHSKKYEDTTKSLELWKKSAENSIKFKEKYLKNIIIVKFDDLILNTESTMKKICQKININYEEVLLKPTFNGESIASDSSFKSTINIIDKSVLSKKNNENIFSEDDDRILNSYESWFKNIRLFDY